MTSLEQRVHSLLTGAERATMGEQSPEHLLDLMMSVWLLRARIRVQGPNLPQRGAALFGRSSITIQGDLLPFAIGESHFAPQGMADDHAWGLAQFIRQVE